MVGDFVTLFGSDQSHKIWEYFEFECLEANSRIPLPPGSITPNPRYAHSNTIFRYTFPSKVTNSYNPLYTKKQPLLYFSFIKQTNLT